MGSMNKAEMKDKQSVEGVCQFCGMVGYCDEETHEPAEEPQDGLLVLSNVTAQVGGIYGEWYSMECFWNDLLCQAQAKREED